MNHEPLNELKAKKIWSTFLTKDDYLMLLEEFKVAN